MQGKPGCTAIEKQADGSAAGPTVHIKKRFAYGIGTRDVAGTRVIYILNGRKGKLDGEFVLKTPHPVALVFVPDGQGTLIHLRGDEVEQVFPGSNLAFKRFAGMQNQIHIIMQGDFTEPGNIPVLRNFIARAFQAVAPVFLFTGNRE